MSSSEKMAALTPMEPRFQVIGESTSGHCCFESTVIDTSKRADYSNEKDVWYEHVCECFEHEDALRIAKLLNEECKP